MINPNRTGKKALVIFIALTILSGAHAFTSETEQIPSEAKVVFYVACYDVGKAALKDLKGVKKVVTGFKNHREIDTVYYYPEMISIEKMEEALKKAGTYRGTEK